MCRFRGKRYGFTIKHIAPKRSPYAEKGMWHVANNFNTGIIHAEGELIIILGDCSEFLDPEALQKYWNYYKRGYFAGALFTYYHKGEQLRLTPEYERVASKRIKDLHDAGGFDRQLWEKDKPVRDTRWPVVEKCQNGVMLNAPIDGWYYGYSSASLEACLKLNGYDELFDGSKGLEDCDFGSRLKMAGYTQYALDMDLTVVEHWHEPVSEKAVWYNGPTWKSNWIILQLNRERNRFKANSERLSPEDIAYIRRESVGWDGVTAESARGPIFDWWVKSQPIFDLREERLNAEL
jgi:hypothetical protein